MSVNPGFGGQKFIESQVRGGAQCEEQAPASQGSLKSRRQLLAPLSHHAAASVVMGLPMHVLWSCASPPLERLAVCKAVHPLTMPSQLFVCRWARSSGSRTCACSLYSVQHVLHSCAFPCSSAAGGQDPAAEEHVPGEGLQPLDRGGRRRDARERVQGESGRGQQGCRQGVSHTPAVPFQRAPLSQGMLPSLAWALMAAAPAPACM